MGARREGSHEPPDWAEFTTSIAEATPQFCGQVIRASCDGNQKNPAAEEADTGGGEAFKPNKPLNLLTDIGRPKGLQPLWSLKQKVMCGMSSVSPLRINFD